MDIRNTALRAGNPWDEARRLVPHNVYVDLSNKLYQMKQQLDSYTSYTKLFILKFLYLSFL